jgi:hypothetical protein
MALKALCVIKQAATCDVLLGVLPRMIHGEDLTIDRPDNGADASDREQEGSEKHVGTLYTTAPLMSTAVPGSEFHVPGHYGLLPIANRLPAPRTYMTPSERAGVAINNSPIELVARCSKVGPARTTSMSPSSFDR